MAIFKHGALLVNKKSTTDKVTIFLHIPKTGGLTLYSIFRNYHATSCDFIRWTKDLIYFPKEQKDRIEIICGHCTFGIHNQFPNKEYSYITLIRNPVEHVISHYYFIRKTSFHPLHDILNRTSLFELLTDEKFQGIASNFQTRYLAGNCENNLEYAKSILEENFDVVGITDRFEDTLFCIKKNLNMIVNNYNNLNVNTNKPSKEKISKEIIELIIAKNEKDFELYKFANNLLDVKISTLE